MRYRDCIIEWQVFVVCGRYQQPFGQTNLILTCKQLSRQTIFVSNGNGLIIRVEFATAHCVRALMPTVVSDFVVSDRANNNANSGQYLGQNWRGLISKSNTLPRSLQLDLSMARRRERTSQIHADRITASVGICNRMRYTTCEHIYLDKRVYTLRMLQHFQ